MALAEAEHIDDKFDLTSPHFLLHPKTMPFLQLPNELILLIAHELKDFPNLNALLRTNRRLASLLSHEIINMVFRNHDSRYARRLLFSAASRVDRPTCEHLIQERRILDTVRFRSGTALRVHAAISGQSATVIRTLLRCSGIDVNEQNPSGKTPLLHAVERAHVTAVQLLLRRRDIDVNFESDTCRNVLHVAVFENYVDVALALLEDPRTDVNHQERDGLSALHLAAREGHGRMVGALLTRRDIEVNIVTKGGYTPLRLAEARGFRGVAHVLVADERVDIGWGDDNLRSVRLYRWMYPPGEPSAEDYRSLALLIRRCLHILGRSRKERDERRHSRS